MNVRIDCDTCLVRGLACHDCVVTALLGPPPEQEAGLHPDVHDDLYLGDDERRALEVLAAGGLVSPLRLVTPVTGPEQESA